MKSSVADVTKADELVLRVRNLSKTFGGNTVLRKVAFDLFPGEIHALVGENGSGKSTFIKCIAGFHEPDDGSEISVDGQRLPLPYGPSDAVRFGLGFVHQNLGLIPTLSVSDNLGLYRKFNTSLLGAIRWKEQRAWAREALSGFASHIDPDMRVSDLAQADKTLVAIARGLASAGAARRVLVLDEPTAALPGEEVDYLFSALRKLAATGVSLIYVSHRLPEILSLAGRVTALRDGCVTGTHLTSDLDERALVQLIIGRPMDARFPVIERTPMSETLLEVDGITGNRVRDVSFNMRRGEIVGIAGLLGSGRSELGRLIFGAQIKTSGTVRLRGKKIDIRSPSTALANGIGYIPEDRLGKGGVGAMTVTENLTLPSLRGVWVRGRLRKGYERRIALDLVNKYRIRPPNPAARFSSLSGGNQQKCIIARALRLKPDLLILDEPVQGVDVGSKTDIFLIVQEAAAQGTSVLVIDSDFADLCHLCDRVLVLKDGELVSHLSGDDRKPHRIADIALTS